MARIMVARGFVTLDKLETLSLDDVDDHVEWQQAYDDAQERLAKRNRPKE